MFRVGSRLFAVAVVTLLACVPSAAPSEARPSPPRHVQGPERLAPAPGTPSKSDATHKPVTVVIRDSATNKPVTEFSYQYWIHSPNRRERSHDENWRTVKSAEGLFTIDAPSSCEITVCVKAKQFLGGFGDVCRSYIVKAADKERRIVVSLRRGIIARGTVRDAKSDEPIKGAKVAPIIFCPPLYTPDWDRAVSTDAKGRFVLEGVDPWRGAHVSHQDYLDKNLVIPGDESDVSVKLEMGDILRGIVKDNDGVPVSGAQITDGARKRIVSRQDGTFVFKSPSDWQSRHVYGLEISKDGYIPQHLQTTADKITGLVAVLRPLFELRGKVRAADGKPVPEFKAIAGPGEAPPDFLCVCQTVKQGDGSFALKLEKNGKCWLGVRAAGHAAWEGWVDIGRNQVPMAIILQAGVTVSGRILCLGKPPKAAHVRLVPRRRDADSMIVCGNPARDLGTLTEAVDPNGSFRLEHVRPDIYRLEVSARGITPSNRLLVVTTKPVDVGVISVRGTGQIAGQIFRPAKEGGGACAFAHGAARPEGADRGSSIPFTADENGRFLVHDVPVGINVISIPYRVSADVFGSYAHNAQVIEQKTTEVRILDPKACGLSLMVVVGNGSRAHYQSGTGIAGNDSSRTRQREPPMYLPKLQAQEQVPLSFAAEDWKEPDGEGRIVIPGVEPGRYRLRFMDWEGRRGFEDDLLHESDIVVPPAQKLVRIALGAGSITGRVRSSRPIRHMIQVLAVSEGNTRPIRWTRCDGDGNFCVPYLFPGKYVLFAHDHQAGWCRIPVVEINDNTKNVGVHELNTGGTIRGKIVLGAESREPGSVVATDSFGTAVEAVELEGITGQDFVLSGLWPGRWTVRVLSGKGVLATSEAWLKGTESFQVRLMTK